MTGYLKEVLEKLGSASKVGPVAGWCGVVWRTISSILVSYIYGRMSGDAPMIYKVVLVAALSYLLITLFANLFFLVAVIKSWPYVLLPYIVFEGMDLIFCVFLIIIGSSILEAANVGAVVWLIIPGIVIFFALNVYFFAFSLMLFKEIEADVMKEKNKELGTQIHDITRRSTGFTKPTIVMSPQKL